MSYITSIDHKYTEIDHKDGSKGYIDEHGYESLTVDHENMTIVKRKNGCPTMNGSSFFGYMESLLGIDSYQDISVQTYMKNTSEKKLKAQGFKKIPS